MYELHGSYIIVSCECIRDDVHEYMMHSDVTGAAAALTSQQRTIQTSVLFHYSRVVV